MYSSALWWCVMAGLTFDDIILAVLDWSTADCQSPTQICLCVETKRITSFRSPTTAKTEVRVSIIKHRRGFGDVQQHHSASASMLGALGSDCKITPPNIFTGERTVVACEGKEAAIKCGKSVHMYIFYCLYVNVCFVLFFSWFSLFVCFFKFYS